VDKKLAESLPWPYQLVRIEAVSFARKYDRLYPQGVADGTPVKRGFVRFKDECLRCHSINLQGGDVGPELNTPKNILEYWDPKTARQFIRDPGSFRAKSKMPAFPHLTDPDLDDLFAYLSYMRERKTR
jgi:mono/diheme cytochrome c family protein